MSQTSIASDEELQHDRMCRVCLMLLFAKAANSRPQLPDAKYVAEANQATEQCKSSYSEICLSTANSFQSNGILNLRLPCLNCLRLWKVELSCYVNWSALDKSCIHMFTHPAASLLSLKGNSGLQWPHAHLDMQKRYIVKCSESYPSDDPSPMDQTDC